MDDVFYMPGYFVFCNETEFCFVGLFRFASNRFVSFRFVFFSFRFIFQPFRFRFAFEPFRFKPFRFVSFRFLFHVVSLRNVLISTVSFRFVSLFLLA